MPAVPLETTARTVARILLETGAVLMRPADPFTLTSGEKSPVYVDCRKLIAFPRARRFIVQALADTACRMCGFESIDGVAGGETAGIAYAAWVAEVLGLPMAYVRKKPKGFGRGSQIEGVIHAGQRILLVEDLATDGGSKAVFVRALNDVGASVPLSIVVFHYGIFPYEGTELAQLGVPLKGLATWADVLDLARAEQRFPTEALAEVEAFLNDPAAWRQQHGG
jgi:orotate phosphoribosyltransferase